MENIEIKEIIEEAEHINNMIKKITEASSGTYKIKEKDLKTIILLSYLDCIEDVTNKVISIDTRDNQSIIHIEEAKENGLFFL